MMDFFQFGKQLQKQEGDILSKSFAAKIQTLKEYRQKLLEETATIADLKKMQLEIKELRSALKFLATTTPTLNYHGEANRERALASLKGYQKDLKAAEKLIKAKIASKTGKKPQPSTPHTLGDIFQPSYRKHFMKFVGILRNVDPPLINVDSEWIGVKGAAKVFKEALEAEGVIIGGLPRNTIYTAFEFFPNLGKSFMKVGIYLRAEDYRADFLRMIQQIKTEI